MFLQAKGVENDFKKEAERLLPHSKMIPTLTDLKTTFQPIMHPETNKKFNAYFEIMYREDFPKPAHPTATIIGGFRCLYIKMNIANEQATEQERLKLQLKALNDLFALHATQIAFFDPDLAREITGFGCEDCKINAKAALGIEGEHLSYIETQSFQLS